MHLLRKRPKIVATILAKDEEDILDHMIKHHINVGIEAFIVTNNRSSDKTRDIAESYKEVYKIFDEMDDTHHQEAHVTKMARYACKLKPEWIVHLDADEFWNGFEFLDGIKENGVISEVAFIHPPVTPEFGFDPYKQRHYLDMKVLQEGETKVIHRPNENIVIQHGNHWMDNVEGPMIPTKEIYRHHYPLRCYQQMVTKAVIGHKAMMKRKGGAFCGRWGMWHDLYEEGKLEGEFNRILGNWSEMIETGLNEEKVLEMVKFYAGSQEGVDRATEGIKSGIIPEIKEWAP